MLTFRLWTQPKPNSLQPASGRDLLSLPLCQSKRALSVICYMKQLAPSRPVELQLLASSFSYEANHNAILAPSRCSIFAARLQVRWRACTALDMLAASVCMFVLEVSEFATALDQYGPYSPAQSAAWT